MKPVPLYKRGYRNYLAKFSSVEFTRLITHTLKNRYLFIDNRSSGCNCLVNGVDEDAIFRSL